MNRTRIGTVIVRLIDDEDGQDLIEYALLTGTITFGAVVVVLLLEFLMRYEYLMWQTLAQTAWEPCPPGGCP